MALYCKIIDVRKPSRFQAEAVYELRDDNGQPANEAAHTVLTTANIIFFMQ